MGKIISIFFTLGIGIIIGINLPKDKLEELNLPELSQIKLSQKSHGESIVHDSPPVDKIDKTPVKKVAATSPKTQLAIKPDKQLEPKITPPKSGLFTVQIASFAKKREAEKYVDRLNEQQIDAYIAPLDLSQNKDSFRVFVGEYTNRTDAQAKKQLLAKRFKDAFVQGF